MSKWLRNKGISNLVYYTLTLFEHIKEEKSKYSSHVSNTYEAMHELRELSSKTVKELIQGHEENSEKIPELRSQLNSIITKIGKSIQSIIDNKKKPCQKMWILHVAINDALDYTSQCFDADLAQIKITTLEEKVHELQQTIAQKDEVINKLTFEKTTKETAAESYIQSNNPGLPLEVRQKLQIKEPEPNTDGKALKPSNMDSTLYRKQQISLLKQESCRQQNKEAYAASKGSVQTRDNQGDNLLVDIISTLERNQKKQQSSQMFSSYFAEQQPDQSTTSHTASPSQPK
ncbi:hypothetical protein [Piscirickettsia salmonis]|uniref:hypothetical protein n=1 Tax=Piscirickettsia salmonis TaxID=1238 RepID=UPI0007C97645|nr:hypothetical protein A0O36_02126 [Piscirickettsiaceae bacterium NZ-RLO1]